MLWLVFAFLTAFFESMKDVFSKKSLKNIDEYVVAWSLRFFALLLLLPLLFFVEIPKIGEQFWFALFVSGILNSIATILYMKAIKFSELSLTVPMVAFTPLFLLITSPLILGEFPGVFGLAGVLLIVLGSYVLNIKEKRNGYLAPFKALLRERGPRLMLTVAFIWSICGNFDKIGVLNSSPVLWSIVINAFIALCMLPVLFFKSRGNIKQIPANLPGLLPIGLFGGLMYICQMTAFSLTLVAYVISIKRLSVVLGVVFGGLIFKEEKIKERLLGAAIMVLGVLFIALF